ncbi:MAG: hypothetical protein ACREL7_13145 [Longimicrobiales bacterium]
MSDGRDVLRARLEELRTAGRPAVPLVLGLGYAAWRAIVVSLLFRSALMAIATPGARTLAFFVFFAACALYGRALTHFARDDYLPLPGE